jgi:DnaJ-class molecular chaperone
VANPDLLAGTVAEPDDSRARQPGRSFRLRGKGLPHLGDPPTRSDLFARVRLVLPDPLTDLEINSIRELASSRTAPVQTHLNEVKT